MPPDVPAGAGPGARPPGRRRRIWTALGTALAAGALVVGAFSVSSVLRGPDSDEATLRGFQIRVLNVSQAAAENRLDGALDALEALERDLDLAAGEGLISAARYRGIEAALEAVRADISSHITAQSAAAVEAKTASAAEVPAVQSAAPEPQYPQPAPEVAVAPAPEPAPEEPELPAAAKEAKGKGKGAGKP